MPRSPRHMFLECAALAKADLLIAADKDLAEKSFIQKEFNNGQIAEPRQAKERTI